MSNEKIMQLLEQPVTKEIKKKGKFSYLSWSYAWGLLIELRPDSTYEFLPTTRYPDGTMEVSVSVTVNNIKHTMILPVMNNYNKPIENPNAFDINNARMRCLVKAIAMHGLGLYIYAGEDLPDLPIFDALEKGEAKDIVKAWKETSQEDKKLVWGQLSETQQKTIKELL